MLTIENVNQDIETTLKLDKSEGEGGLAPTVATQVIVATQSDCGNKHNLLAREWVREV